LFDGALFSSDNVRLAWHKYVLFLWVEAHALILGMVPNFGIWGSFILDTALATAYCKPSRALCSWDRVGRFIAQLLMREAIPLSQ